MEVYIIKSGEYEVSSRVKDKKEFHLELTEKLMGKNYMKKFLKPKESHLSLLGVGQLIWEHDLLANSNNDKIKNSSVTVTWNSLTGSVYSIKAIDFLKAMKRDLGVWDIFESHWKRKFGETESRFAIMNSILENNTVAKESTDISTPSLMLNRNIRTVARPKRMFDTMAKAINKFGSGKNIFGEDQSQVKRIEYKKVSETVDLFIVSKYIFRIFFGLFKL